MVERFSEKHSCDWCCMPWQADLPNMKKYLGRPITVSTLNGTVRQGTAMGCSRSKVGIESH